MAEGDARWHCLFTLAGFLRSRKSVLLLANRYTGAEAPPPIGSAFACNRPVTPPRCVSAGDNLRHFFGAYERADWRFRGSLIYSETV